MFKNKDIKEFSNTNIEDMFTYVDVNISKLSEEEKDALWLEGDNALLTLSYALELVDKNKIEYNDIDFNYTEWDDVAYYEFLCELVKKAEHYLVYLPNSTWRGASGCGIVNSIEDAFSRGYEKTQLVKGISKGNKAVLLKEYHHDVPMGHHALIIALTDREYNKLKDADFNTMEEFALAYMYLETNKRELLKTIVNL